MERDIGRARKYRIFFTNIASLCVISSRWDFKRCQGRNMKENNFQNSYQRSEENCFFLANSNFLPTEISESTQAEASIRVILVYSRWENFPVNEPFFWTKSNIICIIRDMEFVWNQDLFICLPLKDDFVFYLSLRPSCFFREQKIWMPNSVILKINVLWSFEYFQIFPMKVHIFEEKY